MKHIFLTYLLAFISCGFSIAQIVKGNVVNKDTKEPIPFANVFFSGTLIGSTTDLEGNFSFSAPKEGKYELIVSYIGFQQYAQQILSTDDLPFLEIELEPEVIELKDIHVEADTTGWEKNYPVFKQLFLGETQNASKVEIVNPRDIFLFYDHVENGLFAHSRKEIEIMNYALGYKLNYIMQQFSMEYRKKLYYSLGIPRFEELQPKGKGQQKKWNKARIRAYNGSFGHFLRSLKHNTFVEEGFIVQELFRIPNPERPSDELIREKIRSYQVYNTQSSDVVVTTSSNSDSLRYWMRMRRLPLLVDSLGKVFKDNSLVRGDTLFYGGLLRITYTKEKEDPNYRPGDLVGNQQTSVVHLADYLVLYDNSYYDVEKVLLEGYWGWSSKITEMLPLEYIPPSND